MKFQSFAPCLRNETILHTNILSVQNFGINPPENQIVEEFEAIKEYLRKLKAMLTRLEIIKKWTA